MYVSDLDQSEIPTGQAYQLSIRHPDGSTQQLDISEKNYRDLKLAGVGKTLKKRGRKPGSTTGAAGALPRRRPSRAQLDPVGCMSQVVGLPCRRCGREEPWPTRTRSWSAGLRRVLQG